MVCYLEMDVLKINDDDDDDYGVDDDDDDDDDVENKIIKQSSFNISISCDLHIFCSSSISSLTFALSLVSSFATSPDNCRSSIDFVRCCFPVRQLTYRSTTYQWISVKKG